VQNAKGKTVRLVVRSTGLMPADVGSVEGDGHGTQPNVKPANSAAVFIGGQYTFPKPRIPTTRS
jgi:hypothetical protein